MIKNYFWNPTPRSKTFHSLKKDIEFLFTKSFPLKRENYLKLKNDTINEISVHTPFLSKNRSIKLYPYARTALYVFLKSLNLKEGSEVIISGAHIPGFLQVILELNLIPVVLDIDTVTFCIDAEKLRNAISAKTKIVIITYLFGYVPDIEKIFNSIPKGIIIVEDISQAIGASFNGKRLGTFGHVSITSTSLGKFLDGSGGSIMTVIKDFQDLNLNKIERNILKNPSIKTNVKRQLKSLIYNLLTSSFIFPFCHLLISIVEKIIPGYFKQFRFSFFSNKKEILKDSLKEIHFEDISPHSLSFIKIEIPKLLERIEERRSHVRELASFLNNNFQIKNLVLQKGSKNKLEHTYWQLALHGNTNKFRSILLKKGIETSCSNLTNLSNFNCSKINSYSTQKNFNGINYLFTNTIFFPLNNKSCSKNLIKNIKIFNKIKF